MTHSHAVMAKPAALTGLNVTDTFTRADSTTTLGSTESPVLAWTARQGTWGINTNRGYRTTTGFGDHATIDTSVTDHHVTVALQTLAGIAASFEGLVARYVDSNNFYLVQKSSATQIQLFKKVAGSFTQLGVTTSIGTWAAGNTVGLRCSGTAIAAYYNGASVIAATDSALTTGTNVGLYVGGANNGTRFDDFSAVAP